MDNDFSVAARGRIQSYDGICFYFVWFKFQNVYYSNFYVDYLLCIDSQRDF